MYCDSIFLTNSPISETNCTKLVLISSTAPFVCSARLLTSSATTAKPLPDSPALVASIDALSANRLVCPDISETMETILVIFLALNSNSIPFSLTSLNLTKVSERFLLELSTLI